MADMFTDEQEENIVLVDDEGQEHDFVPLATVEYKERFYIVLEPKEVTEELPEGTVLIYRLGENEDGEDTFENIEDENELNAVFEEFMKMVEADEHSCDDDDCDCCHHHCDCGCED